MELILEKLMKKNLVDKQILEYFGPSTRSTKRFMMVFSNPKQTVHFGSKNGSTFIDHKDDIKRENYIARHSVNENWSYINPGSASASILWGNVDLLQNLNDYLSFHMIDKSKDLKIDI